MGPGRARPRRAPRRPSPSLAATGAVDLYPGFTGGNVYFTMNNTNPYPVTFTSMTPGIITSSDQTNCPATNVSVISATGLNLTFPANTTSPTSSVNGVVSMASTRTRRLPGRDVHDQPDPRRLAVIATRTVD